MFDHIINTLLRNIQWNNVTQGEWLKGCYGEWCVIYAI